jgi:8-oxo-dGTP pyrophosphatase MutT (NUDIX family)
VLLLLYSWEDEPHLILTVRTPDLNHHSGQISLPGGGWERQDGSLRETALRETEEELGVDTADVEVLGPLTPLYIPPSNNCVYPFVAVASQRPDFHPDPIEVADLLEIPLSLLADPTTRCEEEWIWRDQPLRIPFYAVDEHKVWGATAIILAEFLALLDREGGEQS